MPRVNFQTVLINNYNLLSRREQKKAKDKLLKEVSSNRFKLPKYPKFESGFDVIKNQYFLRLAIKSTFYSGKVDFSPIYQICKTPTGVTRKPTIKWIK